VSKGIITGIYKRNKAWNEYNKIPNYLNQNKNKMLRNKVTDMIKKAKVNFEMGLVKKIKEDPKSFYAYVKSKSRAKVGRPIGPLLDKLGKLSNYKKIMSDIINDYFSSVFTKEDLATMPDIV